MIEIKHEQSGLVSSRSELNSFARDIAACTLRELGWNHASITVLFCSNKRIQQLNHGFLGIDAPTDVLSFPATENADSLRSEEAPYLGDVAIALPYVSVQARKACRELEEEIALLLVHGVLHLLGWGHDTMTREKQMWKEQERLLGLICDVPRPKVAIRD